MKKKLNKNIKVNGADFGRAATGERVGQRRRRELASFGVALCGGLASKCDGATIIRTFQTDWTGRVGAPLPGLGTNRSLGHAYVNYSNPADAAMALNVLNFTPIHNRPIRIMYSIHDPSISISGAANIFIKNLDKTIGNKELHEIFCSFGNILSCKVAIDAFGQSKGYGFVQFEQEEAAQNAINRLNGMLVNDKPVYVGPFIHKQERESSADKTKFCNVFIKNLSESTTKEDLEFIFGKYGKITSAVVMTWEDGKSKCFGFVNFEMPDAAAQAVHELNGQKI